MSTWEWVGTFLFGMTTILLFFAAFGGSNLTEQSVEDYMRRLMRENQSDKK